MSGQIRIVFRQASNPGIKFYFQREIGNQPDAYEDVTKATHFQPEIAVAFRDRFRQRGFDCYLEDRQGNGPLYEPRAAEPQSAAPDARTTMWVEPDTARPNFGFLVQPAIRPSGKCWCIRPADVPSMAEHGAYESIYAATPEEAVAKATATWGSLAESFEKPWLAQEQAAEARRILEETKRTNSPGRRRPGDSR